MSGSTACSYEILGVSDLANSEVNSFDILEKLEERNLLHIRDRIFGALDDRDINNCSQVSKSWQSFMETIRPKRMKMMRMKMDDIGGAGHFWGNDKASYDGLRDTMKEKELKRVPLLLMLGFKKIHLKFLYRHNWEVTVAEWTIKFKTAWKGNGGDGKYYYLWFDNKEGGAKFKATAQEINGFTGEEANRRELQSEKDGTRERIKYEQVDRYDFVRFNITFL